MKILVIQLTRPGDIYCTAPTLTAIARSFPEAEVHLLVRKKFAPAAHASCRFDHLWEMDSSRWIEPLLSDGTDFDLSILEISRFIASLRQENFDKIINLSFSPSSSYLTHLVAQPHTEIRGYSRTSDFYLRIYGEASLYFKAHVGVGKANRIHVVDLFGMVAGVEIKNQNQPLAYRAPDTADKNSVVCHLGASQEFKTWPIQHWEKLFLHLKNKSVPVTLIGGQDDLPKAKLIKEMLGDWPLFTDLVGQTTFKELGRLLTHATVFVGGDSGPMHVAGFSQCPVLNLSVGDVNFWETGPISSRSRILSAYSPSDLQPDMVIKELDSMLSGDEPSDHAITCDGKGPLRYNSQVQIINNNGWSTILWLIFGAGAPFLEESQRAVLRQVSEICAQIENQLEVFRADAASTAVFESILKADQVFSEIKNLYPELEPLIDHFFSLKENVTPGSQTEVITQTKRCFEWLGDKANQWCGVQKSEEQEMRA